MTSISGGDVYDVLGGSPLVEGGGPVSDWRSTSWFRKGLGATVMVGLVILLLLAFMWSLTTQGSDQENEYGKGLAWLSLVVSALFIGGEIVDYSEYGKMIGA